jgi:outer membrane protein assembly factor BamB
MLARWIAVVLVLGLVAAVVAAGQRAAAPSVPTFAVERYFPLEIGNTWVYETRSADADGTTTKVTQVIGRDVLGDQPGQPFAAVVETRGYDGDTAHQISYYVPRPDGMYVPISRDAGQHDSDPDFPFLELPIEEGASWPFSGSAFGLNIPTSLSTVEGFEDMTVAGVEAEDCAVIRTDFEAAFGQTRIPVTGRMWLCPGIGLVRSDSVAEDIGLDSSDQLVAFSVAGRSAATEEVAEADRAALEGAVEGAGGGAGLEPGRSNAIDRTVDFSVVAWQDLRYANPVDPPVGTDEVMVLAEEDGTLSAFDHRTGEVAWRVTLGGRTIAPPVIAGGAVVVEDAVKSVTALDLATGRTLWQRSFPDLASAPPLVAEGLAVVPFHDRVTRALRLADGSVAWEVSTEGLVVTPPALAGDLAILADDEGNALALRVADGEEVWSDSTTLPSDAGPAVRDGLVVLADREATVRGLDAATGELRWERTLPNYVSMPVALGPDEVVVHLDSGRVFSLDAGDGSTRWVAEPGQAGNAPVVAGEEVLVLTEDSRIHRLDRGTGRALETIVLPVPGDLALSDTEVDLSSFGGLLVVGVDADEPRSNPYVAYPLDEGAVAGVTVDATYGSIYPPVDVVGPRAAPAPIEDGRVMFPDYGSVVWSATLDGSEPVEQVHAGTNVPWTVTHDDTILLQDERQLLAMPAAGGEPRWTFDTRSDPFPLVAVAVAGGRVFVPIDGGGVTALDLATGAELWHAGPAGIGRSAPLVVGDAVVSSVGGLAAYDPATGEERWRIAGVEGFSPLTADHGVVFASVATDTEALLMAVEVATGRELWRVVFDGPVFIGPTASASTVVGIETNGTVRAFDVATGQERWRFRMRTYPNGPPQIHGNVVAVADEGLRELFPERDYRVTFLDLETGRFVGSYEPSGTAAQLPVFTSLADRLVLYDVGYLLSLEVTR